MKKLTRIVYVSRSTFAPSPALGGLDPAIARILAKSRSNNRKNGLVGVLYFGDGCFFQCLEGEEGAIDTLYGKLEADPRHRDLKLISHEHIEQPTFSAWSMKYIPSEKKIQALMRAEGLESFDPYRFSESGTRKMLALLHAANDPQDAAKDSVAEKPKIKPTASIQDEEFRPVAPKKWRLMQILLPLIAFILFGFVLKYALV